MTLFWQISVIISVFTRFSFDEVEDVPREFRQPRQAETVRPLWPSRPQVWTWQLDWAATPAAMPAAVARSCVGCVAAVVVVVVVGRESWRTGLTRRPAASSSSSSSRSNAWSTRMASPWSTTAGTNTIKLFCNNWSSHKFKPEFDVNNESSWAVFVAKLVGRLQPTQRSAFRIQSSAKFINTVDWIERSKSKKILWWPNLKKWGLTNFTNSTH